VGCGPVSSVLSLVLHLRSPPRSPSCSVPRLHLLSFPTRRSSDLDWCKCRRFDDNCVTRCNRWTYFVCNEIKWIVKRCNRCYNPDRKLIIIYDTIFRTWHLMERNRLAFDTSSFLRSKSYRLDRSCYLSSCFNNYFTTFLHYHFSLYYMILINIISCSIQYINMFMHLHLFSNFSSFFSRFNC